MTDIGPVPSAYVSDGEIIAWIEQKSNEQYGRLDSMMFVSNDRSQLMQDLTNLQANIDAGKSGSDILNQMQEIQQKYAGKELGPEVDQLLLPMEASLGPLVSPNPDSDTNSAIKAAINASVLPDDAKNSLLAAFGDTITNAVDDVFQNQIASVLKDDSAKLKGETDKLGRIDQLDLINIQQLVSDARQTDELGSNILAGRYQTSNSILGNVRG